MSKIEVDQIDPSSGTDLTIGSSGDTIKTGGNLDTNDKNIVTASNRDLNLYPNGTGAVEIGGNTNPGTVILNCESNSHGIKLQSPPHSAGQSYTMKFPSGNITAGKFLKVDSVAGSGATGVGTMTFADAGGGMNTLLSTTNISNASTVDIEANIDSTYSKYYFKLSKLKCSDDNAYLLSRLKVGSYQTSNYQYVNTDTRTNGTTFDNGSQHSTSASYILTQNNNGQGNAATESFDFDIWLSNPSDTAIYKFFWGLGQGFRSEGAYCQHRFFGCYDGGAGAVNPTLWYSIGVKNDKI